MNPRLSPPVSLLASPAMSPLPPDLDPRALYHSTARILDQPSPPTLREILTAYTTKGDGDRDMLLAMLNAKSSEDQRLAALASLQRSILDFQMQTTGPAYALPQRPSPSSGQHAQPIAGHSHRLLHPSEPMSASPPHSTSSPYDSSEVQRPQGDPQLHSRRKRPRIHGHSSPVRSSPSYAVASSHPYSHTRSRTPSRESSASPPTHSRSHSYNAPTNMTGEHGDDLPPSPYSSSASWSAHGDHGRPASPERMRSVPRSPHDSMAINSLLTAAHTMSPADARATPA